MPQAESSLSPTPADVSSYEKVSFWGVSLKTGRCNNARTLNQRGMQGTLTQTVGYRYLDLYLQIGFNVDFGVTIPIWYPLIPALLLSASATC